MKKKCFNKIKIIKFEIFASYNIENIKNYENCPNLFKTKHKIINFTSFENYENNYFKLKDFVLNSSFIEKVNKLNNENNEQFFINIVADVKIINNLFFKVIF